jgi:hypothetical protein
MVQTINDISFYIRIIEKMIYKRSAYFQSLFLHLILQRTQNERSVLSTKNLIVNETRKLHPFNGH